MTQTTFEQGQSQVAELVKRFSRNAVAYRGPTYNEAQARIEFINPFFEALGWDVHNRAGYAPQYRHVDYEYSVEVEGVKKSPDYAFKVSSRDVKFFAEAKKPGVNIKTNADAAYQVRAYGWNVKLPVSLLTDFEEFAVYDCRARPAHTDKPSVGRIQYYVVEEYAERFRDLWDVFSFEVVTSGKFDQFAQSEKGKRGTSPVDAEFLKEIEGWRDVLARNMALRNPRLQSVEELNDAVQRTIDRIIFLRIAEDRGIEPYAQLRGLADREGIYADLIQLCSRADARYNSGLFDLKADTLTPKLAVDDKVLRPILADLYHPRSPYLFNLMPPEILGNVYEQFLGKVIRLTAAHQAKVEEKPEVKKAGGVYYTPAYIVEYIVKNTVGKLVEGASPKQLGSFRCLDPACGSGSFLLGAYQYLLDYYLNWYTSHSEPSSTVFRPRSDAESLRRKTETLRFAQSDKGKVYQAKDGSWRLTTAEKKRILTTHIFGVDIDRQAVEVTKLSLLLKVLEGESDEALQPTLFQERALPNLDNNIKCGNSLIGPDYFTGQLLHDKDELRRVNPFDWAHEFPKAISAGGFDCVVGNPPYVRQESLSLLKDYLSEHYEAFDGVADLYVYFIEQGTKLLRSGGLFSIIVSSSFLRATYGTPLRRLLRDKVAILELVDFGGLAVFQNAKDTYVCIPLLGKQTQPDLIEVCKVNSLGSINLAEYVPEHQYKIPALRLTSEPWSLDNESRRSVFQKIMACGIGLGEYVHGRFSRGVTTGLNEAFVIDTATRKKLVAKDRKSTEIIKPLLQGEDIRRWRIEYKDRWIIFARRGIDIDAYPAIKAHLAQWKENLTPKEKGSQKRGRKPGSYKWYEIQDDVAYYSIFESPKIIFPDIAKDPRFYFDTSGHYLANTAYALGTDDLYLLGILNSKLFWFAIGNISIPFGTRAGKYRYRLIYQYMEKVPIRPINFSDPADVARHDRMVTLVEQMLQLHQQQAAASEHDRALYQRQIDATDREIDKLVYELYGLSGEEIQVIAAS